MSDIYRQHEQTFRGVAAWVVFDEREQLVARVTFTFARSGLRTTCWFHVIGLPMVKAFAGGGGYDKASAAAHKAVGRVKTSKDATPRANHDAERIKAAITDTGHNWNTELVRAGFRVIQAV